MEEGAEGARPDFGKLEVVAFASRRAQEMATLISTYGGVPIAAPSVREVPLEDNPVAFAFAQKLFAGELDAVIFTTGVGTRTLVAVLESRYPRARIAQALSTLVIVARGPKPVKVLRELQVPIAVAVSEPHTWREILRELRRRGADVLHVPVCRWALPEDFGPLRNALAEIVEGRAARARRRGLLTTSGLTSSADGPTWPDATTLADLVAGLPPFPLAAFGRGSADTGVRSGRSISVVLRRSPRRRS